MAREVVGNSSEQNGEDAPSKRHSAWDDLAKEVPFAGHNAVASAGDSLPGKATVVSPKEPEVPDAPEAPPDMPPDPEPEPEPEPDDWDILEAKMPNSDAWEHSDVEEDDDPMEAIAAADASFAIDREPMAVETSDGAVGETEPQPQLHEFGAFQLSDEELGANKVVVDKAKRRPFFDIKGRKADKEMLDSLLYHYGSMDGDFGGRITPSVAGELVHALESGKASVIEGSRASALMQLFEKLPLEDQQRIAMSKNGAKLFKKITSENDTYSRIEDSAFLKVAAGVSARLEKQEPSQEEQDALQSFGRVGPLAATTREKSMFFEHTARENRNTFFNTLARCGVGRFDAALTVLDGESIASCADELSDGQKESLTIGHAVVLQQRAWDATDGDKKKCFETYDKVFGGKGVDALKSMLESNFGSRFRDRSEIFAINSETANEMLGIIQRADGVAQELGIGANRMAELVAIEGGGPIVQKITEAWPIDNETRRKNIKHYLLEKEHIDQEYGAGVEDLETFDDMRALYLKGARARLERGDYTGARKNICEYAYGVRLGTVMRNLVAMGVVRVNEKNVRGAMGVEDYYEGIGDIGEKAQIGNLKRLREVGKLSAAEEALVLDAVALARMPGKSLGSRLDLYEAGSGALDLGLGDLLMKTREKFSRTMTREIEAQAQEGLRGARSLGEVEYVDPDDSSKSARIPVLKMEGDKFLLPIHQLGGIYMKDSSRPENWNERSPSKFRPDGHPTGYISTSLLSDEILDVAGTKDPDEIFYAFAELGDRPVVQYAAEYDLYVEPMEVSRGSGQYVIHSDKQDFFYEDPREVPSRAAKRGGGYSEVALDRYGGDPDVHGGKLQPSHLVVFASDESGIGERVKKHAAYFGVPILLIDPNKYGRRKK